MSVHSYFLYTSRDSWLETWDPRTMIGFTLAMSISLVVGPSLLWKSLLLLILVIMWGISRLSWKMLGFTLMPLTLLFLSTMIYHTLLVKSTDAARLDVSRFHETGVVSGLTMCAQIAGLVIMLSLPVRTMPPLVLAEGMERLLSPLKRWRLPVHEAVMMFSIALRFIPILLQEFIQIRKAQIARGGGFHRGGPLRRFRGIIPVLMPMFIQSILKAEELAAAMESRCYNGDDGRTSLRSYQFKLQDVLILIFSAMIMVITLMARIVS